MFYLVLIYYGSFILEYIFCLPKKINRTSNYNNIKYQNYNKKKFFNSKNYQIIQKNILNKKRKLSFSNRINACSSECDECEPLNTNYCYSCKNNYYLNQTYGQCILETNGYYKKNIFDNNYS